ncbi:uncharacterized protein BP5553_05922 [Venustampulla echinocandica]|uniref:Uncharacterized protein n=1 Tax=Venustampulla echinocandica TaxID=2656787 RepID=A0A370TM14_9HELO|nr:uncharacterized protein BP5553_05922 [Venustampulla echinocandica]RDL36570.1 hypothetical protein BP5553_05922 [Venustampulla echinocandica]
MDTTFSPSRVPQAPPPSPVSSPPSSHMSTPYPSRASSPPPIGLASSRNTGWGRADLDNDELASLKMRLRSAESVMRIETLKRNIAYILDRHALSISMSAVPASMSAGQFLPPKDQFVNSTQPSLNTSDTINMASTATNEQADFTKSENMQPVPAQELSEIGKAQPDCHIWPDKSDDFMLDGAAEYLKQTAAIGFTYKMDINAAEKLKLTTEVVLSHKTSDAENGGEKNFIKEGDMKDNAIKEVDIKDGSIKEISTKNNGVKQVKTKIGSVKKDDHVDDTWVHVNPRTIVRRPGTRNMNAHKASGADDEFPDYDEERAMDLLRYPPPPYTIRVRSREVQQAIEDDFVVVEHEQSPHPVGLLDAIVQRAGHSKPAVDQDDEQPPVEQPQPAYY